MSESLQLIFNSRVYPIQTSFNYLNEFSPEVAKCLIFNEKHQYEVNSAVSQKTFESYINSFLYNETPDITIDNIIEYIQLSQELGIFKEVIEKKREEFGNFFINLQNLKNSNLTDLSISEEMIATHLDDYLAKYGKELMNAPINSLYNIFGHLKRNLTQFNLAYELIVQHFEQTKNSAIFILLQFLDGSKLSKENLDDSVKSQEKHLGFMPNICFEYLNNIKEGQEKISSIQNKYEMEIKSIKEKHSKEMDEINKNIMKYHKEINELHCHIDEIKNRILNIDEGNKTMIHEYNEQLKRRMDDYSKQINQKEEKNQQLIEQIESKIKTISEQNQQSIQQIEDKIKTISEQNKQSNEKIENQMKVINKNNQQSIKQIEDNIKTISEQNKQSNEKIENQMKVINEQNQQSIKQIEDKIKTISEQNKQSNEKIENQIKAINKNNQHFQNEFNEKYSEINSKLDQKDKYYMEIDKINHRLRDQNDKTNNLFNKLKEIETKNANEIKLIKEQNQHIKNQINESNKNNEKKYLEIISKFKQSQDKLAEQMKSNMNKQNSELNKNIKTLLNQIEMIKTANNNEIKAMKEQNQKKILNLDENIRAFSEEIKELKCKIMKENEMNSNMIKSFNDKISQLKKPQPEKQTQNDELQRFVQKTPFKINNDILSIVSNNQFHPFTSHLNLTSKGILNCLKDRQKNRFEKPFIASMSSCDVYNLIDPQTKDDIGAGNDGDFFIEFELKNPIKINGMKIFSASSCFPKSFRIEVDCKVMKTITNAADLNGANREMSINFDPILGSKVRFVQTGPNWDKGSNFLNIKRFEILSPETKYSKGVFTTLLQESKEKDPHKCSVLITAKNFDLNSFYLLESKNNICTSNQENSWFQVELVKGYATVNGFRLNRGNTYKMKSYKIICTDDVNKPLESWTTLIEINEKRIDENKTLDIYQFPKPSPPIRFIRLVQTGPTWNNKSYLMFFHFDLFGSYF